MVRNYKKKINKFAWCNQQLHLAINAVLEGNSCKAVALQYNIPRTTLLKKVKQHDNLQSNRSPGIYI